MSDPLAVFKDQQAMSPLDREKAQKVRERELHDLECGFISEPDNRTVAEILGPQTPAQIREKQLDDERTAPGRARAAEAERARIEARDKSMESHKSRPVHELKYPYMDADFPRQED